MTNHWIDLRNSDCVLIMGANPAENHPISFRWVLKAKERGAKVVCVDPRFTKSASQADIYARLRSGTDIAFLGGMIKYILDNDRMHRDYVVNYTNASFLVDDGFSFDAATALFSGYDEARNAYDEKTWQYRFHRVDPDARPETMTPAQRTEYDRVKALADAREPLKDPTLQDPRCVFQLLKRHFARYDAATVSQVTGTPVADLERVYAAFSTTGAPDKAGTIMYAMGWTQHTVGVQNIRAMTIVQMLLGNLGRAGGGVNALRGESNVQGSTDQALLFHILPGYLKAPRASQQTLDDYLKVNTPTAIGRNSANWWGNTPKYMVSLLKSMFGDAATPANGFGYDWLPRLQDSGNYSWMHLFDEMYEGRIRGLLAWGMNPACSGPNSTKTRQALAKLDWLVNVNIFPNETGWFFEDPGLGIRPEDIRTEVFVLPAAASVEKEGSISNSGRWMQWRYKAADAPGDALPDAEIMDLIFHELRALYQAEGGALPEPILNAKWDYFREHGGHREADVRAIAREINGYFLKDVTIGDKTFKAGTLVPAFGMLQADGSTSSGNWIYCASYTEAGNMSMRRTREPHGIGLNPEWAWAWPVNRRILYNRASVDPAGKPWKGTIPVVEWVGDRWVGDVPDGPWPPLAAEGGRLPFIMRADGHAALLATGLKDGPFPEHFEPLESPVTRNPFNGRLQNPVAARFRGELDKVAACGSDQYPYVCSTYRVTEHWQTGVMTRNAPWLLEAVPQIFVEMSEELARDLGIRAGEQVRVSSIRGALTAVALPTKRLRPLQVHGRTVHQVGLPWCFGWRVPNDGSGGDSANLLTPCAGDPNTTIPESKAFLVNIEKIDAVTQSAHLLPRRRNA